MRRRSADSTSRARVNSFSFNSMRSQASCHSWGEAIAGVCMNSVLLQPRADREGPGLELPDPCGPRLSTAHHGPAAEWQDPRHETAEHHSTFERYASNPSIGAMGATGAPFHGERGRLPPEA